MLVQYDSSHVFHIGGKYVVVAVERLNDADLLQLVELVRPRVVEQLKSFEKNREGNIEQ